MSVKGLIAFNSAMKGLRQTGSQMVENQRAMDKIKQEKELFDLKKRQANLALDEERIKTGLTETEARIKQNTYNEIFKQQEQIIKGNEAYNEMTGKKLKDRFNFLKKTAGTLKSSDADVNEFLTTGKSSVLEQFMGIPGMNTVMGNKNKVDRNKVLNLAKDYAKDDTEYPDLSLPERVRKYIPIAEQDLYGEIRKEEDISNTDEQDNIGSFAQKGLDIGMAIGEAGNSNNRQKAIKILNDEGYPTTERNINALLEQMGG